MLAKGTLYVCATPIGNLGDVTLRVLDTLREADLIAAEDTRHSRKLLQHYRIATPMTSYHEHNEKKKSAELTEKLEAGLTIALITDAGLPGISDPGSVLIRLCREKNIPVDVMPGPNAALTALVLSGMPAEHFVFHGFLPAAAGARKKVLTSLVELPFTQIFYVAPHRLPAALEDIAACFGNREAAVVRELTKLHQEVRKGPLAELLEGVRQNPPKGECCLIIAPLVQAKSAGSPAKWRQEVEEEISRGCTKKEAIKEVAKRNGVRKSDVYQASVKAEKKESR